MTHLKRLHAPKTWKIGTKAETFTMRPKSGHDIELSIPLNTLLKQLGIAETKREVEYLLKNETVKVDGKRVHDEQRGVGLMDVVQVPEGTYRVMISGQGLTARETDPVKKLVKITAKRNIKGGDIQVSTLDGRNIIVDEEYNVGDSLLIDLPSQDVEDHVSLEPGTRILLYKGRHTGETAEVDEIDGNRLLFTQDGDSYETEKTYAFTVGDILA